MALGWMKRVLGNEDRERMQWFSGNDTSEAREYAAELRERVLKFKADTEQQGIGFRSDRDAWEAFWHKFPRVHMEFAGRSADDAIAEHAFRQFCRIWRSATKIVRFEGNGTVATAPTMVTLMDGETRVRTDVLGAFSLTDPEERARAITAVGTEIHRLDKDLKGRMRRRQYLETVQTALKSGATATMLPTGEVLIQGMLLPPAPDDDQPLD